MLASNIERSKIGIPVESSCSASTRQPPISSTIVAYRETACRCAFLSSPTNAEAFSRQILTARAALRAPLSTDQYSVRASFAPPSHPVVRHTQTLWIHAPLSATTLHAWSSPDREKSLATCSSHPLPNRGTIDLKNYEQQPIV
jgi:hypothetical protein